MDRKAHWQQVFTTKAEQDVSWFEALPAMSLQMMESAGLGPETCVLDVGGGDSHLVDALASRGLDCLAVLDVSGAALQRAQARLGTLAGAFTWIESDVTAAWSLKPMDIWHDRAVFHFLATAAERATYRAHLLDTVKPGGAVIIATFALDGPERCSGLPVARYSADTLAEELGKEFTLIEARRHEHQTPWGVTQPFVYARFRRDPAVAPIVTGKDTSAPAVFAPLTVLREAKRQRRLPGLHVPPVCLLDPDGDIVRWLKRTGTGVLSQTWACYHSELYEFELAGERIGVVGCAVGAPYAVLVTEQMFVSGCEVVFSITSAGRIGDRAVPPYFVLVNRALRDEGTSYHYLAASRFADADPTLVASARAAFETAGIVIAEGASWTTDAPFRETAAGVAEAAAQGVLAVEMECAGLYAFARAKRQPVLCLAHVTNTMGQSEREFEKGEDDGVHASFRVLEPLIRARVGRRSPGPQVHASLST
jgi:uridine phosphorylase